MNCKNIEEKCIGKNRLSEPNENATMRWLLGTDIANNRDNIQSIKDMILCMDTNDVNYGHLSEDEKILVDKLKNNEEIVDIVIVTLFRWFGSTVGQYSLNELKKGDLNV